MEVFYVHFGGRDEQNKKKKRSDRAKTKKKLNSNETKTIDQDSS